MNKKQWIIPDKRVMDIAYLRDGSTIHTGEALVLACLLHTKGKTKREEHEVTQVAQILDDPNTKPRK